MKVIKTTVNNSGISILFFLNALIDKYVKMHDIDNEINKNETT